MSASIISFAKYKFKKSVMDPNYKEINNLSILFKKYDYKEELKLLGEFYDVFTKYVNELEKANYEHTIEVEEIFSEVKFLSRRINHITKICVDEIMSGNKK